MSTLLLNQSHVPHPQNVLFQLPQDRASLSADPGGVGGGEGDLGEVVVVGQQAPGDGVVGHYAGARQPPKQNR
jgi:hypothetical protein